MARDSTDDAIDVPEPAPGNRYALLTLLEDAIVIYDREDHRAWIQSDGAVALSTMA